MTPDLHHAIERVAAAVVGSEPRAGATRLVAVDGRSGSGKTTVGGALAEQLGAAIVHLDDIYPGWDGLLAGVANVAEWVVHPLVAGRTARWRRYDWTADRYAEWHDVPPAGVVVLEGVGSGAVLLAAHVSLLVWVDAAEPVRKGRALGRDGAAYAPFWDSWAAQEREYLLRDEPQRRADVTVLT